MTTPRIITDEEVNAVVTAANGAVTAINVRKQLENRAMREAQEADAAEEGGTAPGGKPNLTVLKGKATKAANALAQDPKNEVLQQAAKDAQAAVDAALAAQ